MYTVMVALPVSVPITCRVKSTSCWLLHCSRPKLQTSKSTVKLTTSSALACRPPPSPKMLYNQLLVLALGSSSALSSILAQQQPLGIDHEPEPNPTVNKPPAYRDHLLALHKSLVDISFIAGAKYDVIAFVINHFIS